MSHQLNLFLLSLGVVQGLLVAYFLLRNKNAHPSNFFLVLILFVAGLQLVAKLLSKVWLMSNVHFFYSLGYCFPYVMGPLVFLYIKSRAGHFIGKKETLHFIPFAATILLIASDLYFGLGPLEKLAGWIMWAYPKAGLQLISLGAYSYLSWKMIRQTSEPIRSHLRKFLVWLTSAEVVIAVTLALMYVYFGRFPDVRLLFGVLTLAIYWISYQLISQPELFVVKSSHAPVAMKIEPTSKYAHSGLKPEEAERIAQQVREAMVQQRYYLQSNLSIESLAGHLKISRHHLSQVMNERFQKSYFDYINGWRLEEARARLSNPKFAHYTISAIALDSGFSSVSSFNELFKKQYQLTPSKFRGERLKAMSA